MDASDETRLSVVIVNVHPGREDEFDRSIETAARYAAACGVSRLHVMAGLLPSGADRGLHLDVYVASLQRAADRLAKTVRSTRVEGLQNDIPYGFAVMAIDIVGNVSPISGVQVVKPVFDEDAYQHYRNFGGQATGGFCSASVGWPRSCFGAIGLVAVLVGLAFGLRGRRRK